MRGVWGVSIKSRNEGFQKCPFSQVPLIKNSSVFERKKYINHEDCLGWLCYVLCTKENQICGLYTWNVMYNCNSTTGCYMYMYYIILHLNKIHTANPYWSIEPRLYSLALVNSKPMFCNSSSLDILAQSTDKTLCRSLPLFCTCIAPATCIISCRTVFI